MVGRWFIVCAAFAIGWHSGSVPAEASDDPVLRYSLQVDVNDEARVQFADAEADLSRGDIPTAVSRWRTLLDAGANRLVPIDRCFLTVSRAIASRLRSSPPAVRDEYLRLSEPAARSALQNALANDAVDGLLRIVDQYPLTPSAQRCCVELASRAFDAADHSRCAAAVERWFEQLENPGQAIASEPHLLVWQVLSLRALSRVDLADAAWARYAPAVPESLRQFVNGPTTLAELPTSPKTVTELLPDGHAIWRRPVGDSGEWPEAEWVVQDFETVAHPLLMLRPAVAGDAVIASPAQPIELATGTPGWPAAVAVARRRDENLPAAHARIVRRGLGESLDATVKVMGGMVLAIHVLDRGVTTRPPESQLVARDLATGESLWTLSRFPTADPQRESTAFVPGLPAQRGDDLFVPYQVDDRVRLAAVDRADGRVRWSRELGTAGLDLVADARRRWMPAITQVTANAVICATGAGAVACLDAASGQLQWVHQASREDWRDAGPPPTTPSTPSPRFRAWTGLRRPVLEVVGGQIVWAGPEADAVTALDFRTGSTLWTRSREESLLLDGNGRFWLLIGPHSVTRLDILTGQTQWSTMLPDIAGQGFFASDWYVLPLRNGGTAAIHLPTGEWTRSVNWSREIQGDSAEASTFRSLAWTPRGILVRTPTTIALHRPVSQNEVPTASDVRQLALAGEIDHAIELSRRNGDASAAVRLKAIASEKDVEGWHLSDAPRGRGRSEPSKKTVDGILNFLTDRRPESARDLLSTTPLSELSGQWVESNASPRRRVRADVLALRVIADALSSVADSADVVNSLDSALKRIAADEPGQRLPLLVQLRRTRAGRERLLAELQDPSRPVETVQESARRKLAWLAISATGDSAGLGGAISSRTGESEFGFTNAPRKTSITDWPAGEPRPRPPRRFATMLDMKSVTVDHLAGNELAGLGVNLKLHGFARSAGPGVHFTGAGESAPWEIDLPRSNRSLLHSGDLQRASLIGPLAVVQTGTQLYGLLPFDIAGERGASHLWPREGLDAWSTVSNHSVGFLPRVTDATPGRHPPDLDEFGRPIAQTGPMTAAYFAYREFGRLAVCETMTGQRLWDRPGLPADAQLFGDDQSIVVVSAASRRVEVLDSFDGQLRETRPLAPAGVQWRQSIGTMAVLRTGRPQALGVAADGPSALSAVDLRSDAVVWTQPLEPEAVDFEVGRRFAGALERRTLRLFDASTGREAVRLEIDPPREIFDVYAIDDPFAVMICVTAPPAVEQLRPPLQYVGGRRQPYANGIVYGLDPETLALKWTIPLEKSVFPLDQPRDIPLLVIHDGVLTGTANGMDLKDDRVRCFDKRTGRQVGPELRGELIGNTGIVVDRSQPGGWIQVRTAKAIFRFDFESQPP